MTESLSHSPDGDFGPVGFGEYQGAVEGEGLAGFEGQDCGLGFGHDPEGVQTHRRHIDLVNRQN